jgi:hypothetical protein
MLAGGPQAFMDKAPSLLQVVGSSPSDDFAKDMMTSL